MADLAPVQDSAAPRPPSPDLLPFTAGVCGLLGLVFLPLGPCGLILGLVALPSYRRRTRGGQLMTVLALVAGLVSTSALVVVLIWVTGRGRV